MDIVEDDKEYIIKTELPEVKKDDVKVADLCLVKAYKVEFTLEQHTPRLEQLEELVLEDAHNIRDRIRKNIPDDLTKLGEKELLDQFLHANSFAV